MAVAIIKGLAMDAPHAAKSGHQGTAMSLAPLAHVLYSRTMTYDVRSPHWPNRDRFILSAGHASILQYALLYLAGFGLSLDDIKAFRQWGSATPGHPEVGDTSGVEVTTGPLGQGLANMVGMAIAEAQLRNKFGADLFDHHIYGICSDGDLSEGISHEVASLAGHLGLGKLVVCYDDNEVTIDGETSLALSDDAAMRFRSYGWQVIELGEAGEDLDAIEEALEMAKAEVSKPSLVILKTKIAYPAPESTGTPQAHGYAIFDSEIAATKELLGLPADVDFFVDTQVLEHYRQIGMRGQATREAWEQKLNVVGISQVNGQWESHSLKNEEGSDVGRGDRQTLPTKESHSLKNEEGGGVYDKGSERDGGELLSAQLGGRGLAGWKAALPVFTEGDSIATRKASNKVLQTLVDWVPGLTGGGADLTGNTGTVMAGCGVFSKDDQSGRQIYFGVREHGMAAIANGMALHGGALPVVGTFLVFADYMRPAIRLAALSGAHVVFVFSHDSIGVGEDGPTHQPIEQIASLRAIPGLCVIRPADANETAQAWEFAVEAAGPVVLILTRQNVPTLKGTANGLLANGAYLLEESPEAQITLVGTGSEVSLCVAVAKLLAQDGIAANVASMPSWELFETQSVEHQQQVILKHIPSLAVEAASPMGWHRWVDAVHAINRFGASAPGAKVMQEYGFTLQSVAAKAKVLVTNWESR